MLWNGDFSIELELDLLELVEVCWIYDELMLENYDWILKLRIFCNVVVSLNVRDWLIIKGFSEVLIVGVMINVGDLELLDLKKEFERYVFKVLKMLKKKGLF